MSIFKSRRGKRNTSLWTAVIWFSVVTCGIAYASWGPSGGSSGGSSYGYAGVDAGSLRITPNTATGVGGSLSPGPSPGADQPTSTGNKAATEFGIVNAISSAANAVGTNTAAALASLQVKISDMQMTDRQRGWSKREIGSTTGKRYLSAAGQGTLGRASKAIEAIAKEKDGIPAAVAEGSKELLAPCYGKYEDRISCLLKTALITDQHMGVMQASLILDPERNSTTAREFLTDDQVSFFSKAYAAYGQGIQGCQGNAFIQHAGQRTKVGSNWQSTIQGGCGDPQQEAAAGTLQGAMTEIAANFPGGPGCSPQKTDPGCLSEWANYTNAGRAAGRIANDAVRKVMANAGASGASADNTDHSSFFGKAYADASWQPATGSTALNGWVADFNAAVSAARTANRLGSGSPTVKDLDCAASNCSVATNTQAVADEASGGLHTAETLNASINAGGAAAVAIYGATEAVGGAGYSTSSPAQSVQTGQNYVPPKYLVSNNNLKDLFGPTKAPAEMVAQTSLKGIFGKQVPSAATLLSQNMQQGGHSN